MEYTKLITPLLLILFVIVLPYIGYAFLYGATMFKNLWDREWKKKTGLHKVVSTWTRMEPEERMEASIKSSQDKAGEPQPTEWLASPTPDEELREMNERAYREGLLHKLPKTQTQEVKKEDR